MKLWKSLNRRGRNPLSRQETDDMKVHRKTVGEGNCVSWLWWLFDYTFLLKLLTAPEKGKRLLWMLHYFDGYLNNHRPTHGSFSWLSFPPSLPQDLQWQGQALALLPLAALALRWAGRCRPPPGGPTSPVHPKRHSAGGLPNTGVLEGCAWERFPRPSGATQPHQSLLLLDFEASHSLLTPLPSASGVTSTTGLSGDQHDGSSLVLFQSIYLKQEKFTRLHMRVRALRPAPAPSCCLLLDPLHHRHTPFLLLESPWDMKGLDKWLQLFFLLFLVTHNRDKLHVCGLNRYLNGEWYASFPSCE